MPVRTAVLLAATFVFAAPTAHAAATEAFRDWSAECVDDDLCVLANRATGPHGEDVVLALRRTADPDADWQILVSPLDPPIDLTHPFALRVDGGPKLTFNPGYDFLAYGAPDNLFLINEGLAARLFKMMGSGLKVAFFYEPDGGGSAEATFALPGLADGLAWIDERQSRDGTSRRVGPPTDLAPDAAMANLTSPIDGGTGQRGIPNNVLAQHYGVRGCEDLDSELMAKTEPVTARLSDSAILYAVPCTATGPRVAYRLYIVETGEIGGIETLAFARYSTEFGWTGTETLIDVGFDAGSGELSAGTADRDVDGCGYHARWQWRDVRFALIEYRYRRACNGPDDPRKFPVVFELNE